MDVNMETQNEPSADPTPPATDSNLGNKRKGEELEGQITKRLKTEEYSKPTNISDIPPEILREHIFKYFEFIKWIRFLAPVCRLWRQQTIISQAPKQLIVDLTKLSPTLFRILKEFKVDTMIVKAGDLTNIMLALDHAPYLHTLVFQFREEQTPQGRWKQFNNIKTFSVAHCSSLWLLPRFPKLERLHINHFRLKDHERLIRRITPSVKEIELRLDPENLNQDLKTVEESIPTVAKIYVGNSNLGSAFNTDKLIFADLVPDYNAMSYQEYFYRTGATKLSHAIKEGNISKIVSLLLNNGTTLVYEQELKKQEIPFRFPCMARGHDVVKQPINKNEVDNALMSNDYSVFWSVLASFMETNNTDISNIILQIKNYLPVPPHIPKIFAKFITRQTDASIVPEEILKFMLAATNKKGKSFLHLLPKLPFVGEIERFVPYVDFNALNINGENPATVVFNMGKYILWLQWMKYGAKVQADKYHTDEISSMLTLPFATQHKQAIAEIFFNSDTTANEPFIFTVLKLGPMWCIKDHHYSLCPIFDSLLTLHGTTHLFDKNGRSLLNAIIRNFSRVKKACKAIFLTPKLQKWAFDYNLLDKEGKTPLTTAIEIQDQKLVLDLLHYGGAKHDIPDGSGLLPFMQLMRQKRRLILADTDMYFYSAVMNFLDAGVNLNQLDFDECGREMYPVGMAIKHGQPKHRIESLVSYGAELTLLDSKDNSMFHVLMLNENDDYVIEMVPYLAKHVQINASNSYGVTAIQIALQTGRSEKVIQKLTENGAKIDIHDALAILKDPCQLKGLNMPTLIDHNVIIDFLNACQDWPASCIQKLFSDEQVVAKFVNKIRELDVDAIKSVFFNYITTPKGKRLDSSYRILPVFLSSIHLTKLLLTDLGFDINTQTTDGETLLFHINLELDNVEEITQYLLDNGIDINIRDDLNGETVIEKFNQQSPRPETFLLLLTNHMRGLPNIDSGKMSFIEEVESNINYDKLRKKYFQKLSVVNVTELRKSRDEKQTAQKGNNM